jgi:WD40 repeat protein
VAVARDTATRRNLFLIRPDGSELTQLTSHTDGDVNYPTWSPDGSRIAYMLLDRFDQPAQLWWIAVDGSASQMIFDSLSSMAYSAIAWSPDGQWLSAPGFSGGLWVVSADGSQPAAQIDSRSGKFWTVSWTPRGSGWPLFYHLIDSGLYYAAAPGTEPVYFGSPQLHGPIWSADGQWASFYASSIVGGEYHTSLYFYHALLDFLPTAP